MTPASPSAFRWVIPAVFGSVKARNVPRRSAGTVSSAMEKSRTDSSEICAFAGGTGAGLRSVRQPAGASFASFRSTSRLCVESAARATEYGSVTDAVTIFCAAGCHARTWYR